MRKVILILTFASAAFAQPVEGPYYLIQGNIEIKSLQICTKDEEVDVLLVAEDSLMHFRHSLLNHSNTSPPYFYTGIEPWPTQELHEMIKTGDRAWVALLNLKSEYEAGYQHMQLHELSCDEDFVYSDIVLDANSYVEMSGGWFYNNFGLKKGQDDELLIGYTLNGGFGWEPTTITRFMSKSVAQYDTISDFIQTGGHQISNTTHAVAQQILSDSIIGFTMDGWMPEPAFVVFNPENVNPFFDILSCPSDGVLNAGTTIGGTVLILLDRSAWQQARIRAASVYKDTLDIVNCEILGEINSDFTAHSTAFHPSFGFAALQVHHSRLLIARIDTSGNEVQPVGVLYEAIGDTHIVDADVTIADDGRIVVAWSEYDDWNEGARYLKIAAVGWDTFLDTDEQPTPALPDQYSLSAYPNPFNSEVEIEFSLPKSQHATLAIYNTQGQRVATLADQAYVSGSHTAHWLPDGAGGMYFARLETATASKTAKILYLK